ncbi:hypothetical protein [Lacrimispora sp.]|uniref:hypothetical protein n=1 Tax=Lacrimispora sp. TaxID=2719234 RepID=UPI0028A86834|nr:hypothetical protein [Lacrimispora sp.]
MEIKDWITLVVPIIATFLTALIGFGVTLNKIKREFKYTIKSYLYQDIKKLYRDLYVCLEKVILDPMLAFEDRYIDELLNFKPDIYLFSSKNLIYCYRDFGTYLFNINEAFKHYKIEIDYEDYDYDDNGNVVGVNFGEDEVQEYQFKVSTYKEENCPSSKELKEKVENILDNLKKELNMV